jgi:hypothetical protein
VLGLLERGLRPEHVLVDLVGLPPSILRRARAVGICW